MNYLVETIIYILIAVIVFSVIYRLAPFKKWKDTKKPRIVLFPKYEFQYSCNFKLLEDKLLTLGFEKKAYKEGLWHRGKNFGDFSAKKIKLHVFIDHESNAVKLYAPYLGILFDFGDLWALIEEIVSD